MIQPRIRTKIGQIEEPAEIAGQWAVNVTAWNLEGTVKLEDLGVFGPFETESKAREQSRSIVQTIVETLQEKQGFAPTGDFIDMKSGEIRNFRKEQ